MDKPGFLGLILIIGVAIVDAALANVLVRLGKEEKVDFGKGMFVIKRTTPASPESQYLFASPNQDGSWTTEGVRFMVSVLRNK